MVYPILLLPGKRVKKHDKSHKNYSHKKYKTNFVKPNDFYAKKKNVSKKYDKQRSGKDKCFNCGKPRHYSKDCKQKPGKLKNKFNMLNIDEKEQELFWILESNNLSNSLEDDFSSSSESCYHSANDSSDCPNVKIGCRDSYCNVIKSVNVLTKSEENESLSIKLIIQIENPD